MAKVDFEHPNEIISQAQLKSLTLQMLETGTSQAALLSEPVNGSGNLGETFRECLASLHAYLCTCGTEAVTEIAVSMPNIYSDFFDANASVAGENQALERMAVCWLAHLVLENMRTGELSSWAPVIGSRVIQAFPELESLITDEGLIRLENGLSFDRDGIRLDGNLIRFHSALGFSRSDDPDADLLALLCQLAKRTDMKVAVAIESRCYITKQNRGFRIYEDFWRGRPYGRDDLDDPYATGATVYAAPDAATAPGIWTGCTLGGIKRTEFFWKYKEVIKTFEAEEVLDAGFGNGRYVHAEYDLAQKKFRHLDGALMIYSEDDAIKRREINCVLPSTPRAANKPKLFRIDGKVGIDHWSAALSLFFRNNPLVIEYLSGSTSLSIDPSV